MTPERAKELREKGSFEVWECLNEMERLKTAVLVLRAVWTADLDDEERWLREVLVDFRIPFDDHKVGRRVALTGWMRDRCAQIERLAEDNSRLENLVREMPSTKKLI